jgi:NAD(P)-dependent dehydrogenase (short-subunit alcohol dehydrogenase family)
MELAGKAALITGGSRGLGAGLARELARRGARVVVAARGRAELEDVVRSIRAAGGEAHAVVADLGRKEDVEPLAGTACALVGPLDLVVHNASTLGPVPLRPLLDTACEDLGRALEVNVLGPFRLTKAVAGSMLLRERGLVVSITSDAGVEAYERWGAYGASKAALDQLMRIWAAELAGGGVRVLTVDPGEMDTDMHAQAMPDADRGTLARPEEAARRLADLLVAADGVPSGARVDLAAWAAATAVGA